jgi:hypothetical protein
MTELHTNSLDPMIHKQFKLVSIQKNNGLYGSNVKGINETIELGLRSLAGEIKFEAVEPLETMDIRDGSHTQNVNTDLDLCSEEMVENSCKYKKKDLTRISVQNIDPQLHKDFKKVLIDKYGTTKGNVGPELSFMMDSYVKVETGVLRIVETGKTVYNHVVESDITQVVKDVLQTELNRGVNALRRNSSKKQGKGNIKPISKGEKADIVLCALMKSREESFTFKEYKEFLLHMFGQADDRTVKSDLEVLKTTGKIYTGDKRSLYTPDIYCFTENHLYAKYNGRKANRKLFKKFRKEFKGHLQTTEKEIHTFIQKVEGFFDHKSLTERLDNLDIIGLIRPIHEGSSVYNIQLG